MASIPTTVTIGWTLEGRGVAPGERVFTNAKPVLRTMVSANRRCGHS